MGKIRTNSGVLKFRMIPLFLGVKVIDREKSTENLLLLKSVLDQAQIRFMLIAGTLLGAVREKDFIAHDEDVDLAFLAEDKERVLDLLPTIVEAGFTIARYNRRGVLSVMRQGEYIDLYFFDRYDADIRTCDGWLILDRFFADTAPLEFKGTSFLAPRDTEEYLLFEYGANWRTPIVWNNYTMPRWKVWMLKGKEYVKEWLPDWLYFRLARKAQQRNEAQSMQRVQRYFSYKQNSN